MYELKNCPFCGAMAAIKRDIRYPRPECNETMVFVAVCINPDCIIYNADNKYFKTQQEAAAAWNKRC